MTERLSLWVQITTACFLLQETPSFLQLKRRAPRACPCPRLSSWSLSLPCWLESWEGHGPQVVLSRLLGSKSSNFNRSQPPPEVNTVSRHIYRELHPGRPLCACVMPSNLLSPCL